MTPKKRLLRKLVDTALRGGPRAAPGALLPVPAQDSCRVDIKLQQHS